MKKLNHRHEAMINWLIANPHRGLGEMARDLGYSQAWVSTVVNSDMFQAAYRRRCEELGEVVTHSISAKLQRAGALWLDRVNRKLEEEEVSERFLAESGRTILKALGGPTEVQQHQHIHLMVDAERLERARELAAARFAGLLNE